MICISKEKLEELTQSQSVVSKLPNKNITYNGIHYDKQEREIYVTIERPSNMSNIKNRQ